MRSIQHAKIFAASLVAYTQEDFDTDENDILYNPSG